MKLVNNEPLTAEHIRRRINATLDKVSPPEFETASTSLQPPDSPLAISSDLATFQETRVPAGSLLNRIKTRIADVYLPRLRLTSSANWKFEQARARRLETDLASMVTERNQVATLLQQVAQDRDRLAGERDRLNHDLQQVQTDRQQLTLDLQRAHAERERLLQELVVETRRQIGELNSRVEQLNAQVMSFDQKTAGVQLQTSELIGQVKTLNALNEPTTLPDFWNEAAGLYPGLDELLSAFEFFKPGSEVDADNQLYIAFETVLRGSEKVITERQIQYLPFLSGTATDGQLPVVDLGCGRGEFLRLLREHGMKCIGVDVNALHIERARAKGFEVYHTGAAEYLETVVDNSLAGITAFQVIEHLPHRYLRQVLALCQAKLAPGGYVLLETVNPYCLETYRQYYLDPTHQNPLPMDLLAILMRFYGFQDLRVFYQNPIPIKGPPAALPWYYQTYALMGYKR